jgi:hypothetical protein
MTMTFSAAAFAAAVVASVVAACGPPKTNGAESAAAAAKTKAMTQAGDVMLARREAQLYFDSARASFMADRNKTAARSLRNAALFIRHHADSSADPAKATLRASSVELDRLATRAANGAVRSVKSLDLAFARAQLAESQYHCVRALDAWKSKDGPATGSELMMLLDHFERAAVDAARPLSLSAREMITNTRALALKLVQGETITAAYVDSTLASTDEEVHKLAAIVARLKN